MPLRDPHNWQQHAFVQGDCQRCGLRVAANVTGDFWSSEGAVQHVEPKNTNWTVCKSA